MQRLGRTLYFSFNYHEGFERKERRERRMYTAIREIGKLVLASNQNPLQFIVQKNRKYSAVYSIDFQTTSQKVVFQKELAREEFLHPADYQKYLFLGNDTGNNPQVQATTPNLGYLLSQTIPNLIEALPPSPLRGKLLEVRQLFFKATGSNEPKYQEVLDAHKIQSKVIKVLKHIWNDDDMELYVSNIRTVLTLKAKDRVLFTIMVDGKLIAEDFDYISFQTKKNFEEAFNDRKGLCHLCGRDGTVTADTTKIQMKPYITDKVSFAPEIRDSEFWRAFAICPSCYKQLRVGESWVMENLRRRFGDLNLYMIPTFLTTESDTQAIEILEKLKSIPENVASLRSIKAIRGAEFHALLNEIPVVVDFYFVKQPKECVFKVVNHIEGIPPSRFSRVFQAFQEVDKFRASYFPDIVKLSLATLASLNFRGKKAVVAPNCIVPKPDIIATYQSIIQGEPVTYEHLLPQYVQSLLGCQGKGRETRMAVATMKWNLYFRLLSVLGLLRKENAPMEIPVGITSAVGILETPNVGKNQVLFKLKEFCANLGFGSRELGLAIVGLAIGKIGAAQHAAGHHTKPILDKITYDGMNHEMLLQLFSQSFEKARQYKNSRAEVWLHEGMELYSLGRRASGDGSIYENIYCLITGEGFYVLDCIHNAQEGKKAALDAEDIDLVKEVEIDKEDTDNGKENETNTSA